MKNTSKYNLQKPDYTDPVDIQVFNDNADIIDSELDNLNTTLIYNKEYVDAELADLSDYIDIVAAGGGGALGAILGNLYSWNKYSYSETLIYEEDELEGNQFSTDQQVQATLASNLFQPNQRYLFSYFLEENLLWEHTVIFTNVGGVLRYSDAEQGFHVQVEETGVNSLFTLTSLYMYFDKITIVSQEIGDDVIETLYSEESNTYPKGGPEGDYWYEFIYLPHADWAENNPTEVTYIENRTHSKIIIEELVNTTIYNTNYEFGSEFVGMLPDFTLLPGETYEIEAFGEIRAYQASQVGSDVVLNAAAYNILMQATFSGDTEDALASITDDDWMVVQTPGANPMITFLFFGHLFSADIKISHVEYQPLQVEYMPDAVRQDLHDMKVLEGKEFTWQRMPVFIEELTRVTVDPEGSSTQTFESPVLELPESLSVRDCLISFVAQGKIVYEKNPITDLSDNRTEFSGPYGMEVVLDLSSASSGPILVYSSFSDSRIIDEIIISKISPTQALPERVYSTYLYTYPHFGVQGGFLYTFIPPIHSDAAEMDARKASFIDNKTHGMEFTATILSGFYQTPIDGAIEIEGLIAPIILGDMYEVTIFDAVYVLEALSGSRNSVVLTPYPGIFMGSGGGEIDLDSFTEELTTDYYQKNAYWALTFEPAPTIDLESYQLQLEVISLGVPIELPPEVFIQIRKATPKTLDYKYIPSKVTGPLHVLSTQGYMWRQWEHYIAEPYHYLVDYPFENQPSHIDPKPETVYHFYGQASHLGPMVFEEDVEFTFEGNKASYNSDISNLSVVIENGRITISGVPYFQFLSVTHEDLKYIVDEAGKPIPYVYSDDKYAYPDGDFVESFYGKFYYELVTEPQSDALEADPTRISYIKNNTHGLAYNDTVFEATLDLEPNTLSNGTIIGKVGLLPEAFELLKNEKYLFIINNKEYYLKAISSSDIMVFNPEWDDTPRILINEDFWPVQDGMVEEWALVTTYDEDKLPKFRLYLPLSYESDSITIVIKKTSVKALDMQYLPKELMDMYVEHTLKIINESSKVYSLEALENELQAINGEE